MKDMQDVFRAMLAAIRYPFPHVSLVPLATPLSCLSIPAKDHSKLNLDHVIKILGEAVSGDIQIKIHEHEWWEFEYNKLTAKNVPLQFLKIFEIYYGLPYIWKDPLGQSAYRKPASWWDRFVQWFKRSLQ